MKKKTAAFTLSLFIMTLFGLTLNIPPVEAQTEKIYVDDSNTEGPWDGTIEHPHPNITTALMYASYNDTIFVYNGTYHEQLVINKAVSLIGENHSTTIIDGGKNGTVIAVKFVENVTISGFTIQSSGPQLPDRGILAWRCSGLNIRSNTIMGNFGGLELRETNSSKITFNVIADNNSTGILVCEHSNNNLMYGNTMKNNGFGIRLSLSPPAIPNIVHLNNLINNTQQAQGSAEWDNGAEGNYWSDYTGVDTSGCDGIGDVPYLADNYPLMAPVTFFNAGTWNRKTYYVHTVSNSTVSQFQFDPENNTISFKVGSETSTPGFCRVAIPEELVWCDSLKDWKVTVDTTPLSHNVTQNENYTYLHFTYNQGGKMVHIIGTHVIPEFSTRNALLSIVTAAMIATILIVINKRLKDAEPS